MKGFAFVLLCVVAAVQGRSAIANVNSNRAVAALGENPWVVHIRLATGSSGLLNSCTGSIISGSWVITSGDCVTDSRFIWLRFGAIEVIKPELVVESSVTRIHEQYAPGVAANNIALVATNRIVQTTDNIVPIALAPASTEVASTGNFCAYGADGNNPGEALNCYDVTIEAGSDVLNTDGSSTRYDTGAPLVSGGLQVGILVTGSDDSADFLPVSDYLDWVRGETGLDFGVSSSVTVAHL